jgi:hypothetical protein
MHLPRWIIQATSGSLTYFLPITILLLNLIWAFNQPNLFRNVLVQNDFYGELSRQLQKSELKDKDLENRGHSGIILNSYYQQLTPASVKKTVDQNLNLISKWFGDPESDLNFQFPILDIQNQAKQNYDQTLVNVLNKNKLKTCTNRETKADQVEQILTELCVPQGQLQDAKFTNSLQETTENKTLTDKLVASNSNFLEPKFVNQASNFLNTAKSTYLKIKPFFGFVAGFGFLLIVLNLFVYAIDSRKIFSKLKKQLAAVGFHTLILIFGLCGLLTFFATQSQLLQNLFLPGAVDWNLNYLFLSNGLEIFGRALLPSIIFGLTCFSLSLLAWIFSYFEVFENTEYKNKLLQDFENEKKARFQKQREAEFNAENLARNRVKKYYNNKTYQTDYNSSVNNFSVPNSSSEFSYDIIRIKNIKQKSTEKEEKK